MPNDDFIAFLQTLLAEAVRDDLKPAVEEALANSLPEVVRRAMVPPYLTRQQLAEFTGWSLRKVDYLKAERRIPFIQRGRTVLFPTSEIEDYLMEGYVPARDDLRERQNGGVE